VGLSPALKAMVGSSQGASARMRQRYPAEDHIYLVLGNFSPHERKEILTFHNAPKRFSRPSTIETIETRNADVLN